MWTWGTFPGLLGTKANADSEQITQSCTIGRDRAADTFHFQFQHSSSHSCTLCDRHARSYAEGRQILKWMARSILCIRISSLLASASVAPPPVVCVIATRPIRAFPLHRSPSLLRRVGLPRCPPEEQLRPDPAPSLIVVWRTLNLLHRWKLSQPNPSPLPRPRTK